MPTHKCHGKLKFTTANSNSPQQIQIQHSKFKIHRFKFKLTTAKFNFYCFHKNCHETAQEHLLFKMPPVSLTQIEKFLHFSFKTVENFSNSKPRPPGQRKLGETPPGSGNVGIPGGRPGDGQASRLELTDTLPKQRCIFHISLMLVVTWTAIYL